MIFHNYRRCWNWIYKRERKWMNLYLVVWMRNYINWLKSSKLNDKIELVVKQLCLRCWRMLWIELRRKWNKNVNWGKWLNRRFWEFWRKPWIKYWQHNDLNKYKYKYKWNILLFVSIVIIVIVNVQINLMIPKNIKLCIRSKK